MNHICPTCYRPLEPSEEIEVSLDQNCLIWMGLVCQLQATEAEIMSVLASKPGWVTTDEIYGKVYAGTEWPQDRTISVHFTHIRHRLRDADIPIIIESGFLQKAGGHKWRLKYGYG